MDDLIKALQIFRKYGNRYNPIQCGHDVMMIAYLSPDIVSQEDKDALDKLGFFISEEYGEPMFCSFRFGSA